MEWTAGDGKPDENGEPRVWELRAHGFRVAVHRTVQIPGWYLSCYELGIDSSLVAQNDVSAEQAKQAGARRLAVELKERIDRYNELMAVAGRLG